jgi:hypothetical protein
MAYWQEVYQQGDCSKTKYFFNQVLKYYEKKIDDKSPDEQI